MIETERQRQAAMSWIQYWKASVAAGEQSWLGQEEALETVMALRTQIDAYDKRTWRRDADSPRGEIRTSSRETPTPQPATSVPAGSVPCGSGSS